MGNFVATISSRRAKQSFRVAFVLRKDVGLYDKVHHLVDYQWKASELRETKKPSLCFLTIDGLENECLVWSRRKKRIEEEKILASTDILL